MRWSLLALKTRGIKLCDVLFVQAAGNENVVMAVYAPRSDEDSIIRVVDPPGIGHTQVLCPCKQSAVTRNVHRRGGAGIVSGELKSSHTM